MKKIIDTRSDSKKIKDNIFRRERVALIVSPLKFIRARNGSYINHPKDGKVWHDGKFYRTARLAAKQDDGYFVSMIAHGIQAKLVKSAKK